MKMSGIDEMGSCGIPECPKCGVNTRYWVIRDANEEANLGYLNYGFEFAKNNGEFNMKYSVSKVLRDAVVMQCISCGYKDSRELLKAGLRAVEQDRRRFPELVRN